MVFLGLLLVLAVIGVGGYAIWNNQGAFDGSAGTVDVLGYSMQLTNGQVFLAGALAGALLLVGLSLMFRGMGRKARHRASTRRELRELRRQQARTQPTPEPVSKEKREEHMAR